MKSGWVYATAKDDAEAQEIAETLVSEGLIACANIVPSIKSIYRWQGQIQRDTEACMLLKTDITQFERIRSRIRELHSYETPCIVAVEWSHSDTDFLRWVFDSLRK